MGEYPLFRRPLFALVGFNSIMSMVFFMRAATLPWWAAPWILSKTSMVDWACELMTSAPGMAEFVAIKLMRLGTPNLVEGERIWMEGLGTHGFAGGLRLR